MKHLYVDTVLVAPVIDNNCYNELPSMFGYNGTPYSKVSDFHTAHSAFETNGKGVTGTLGLNNPGAGDFVLGSSVCQALGNSAVGVTTDYSGYLFAPTPSSGAYQYR
jgi:hypothetical protein